MTITVEISLYPLIQDYEEPIINLIKQLKSNTKLEVYTHAMSTYIKGESDQVFSALNEAYKQLDKDGITAPLVIKVVNKDLPVQEGFLAF